MSREYNDAAAEDLEEVKEEVKEETVDETVEFELAEGEEEEQEKPFWEESEEADTVEPWHIKMKQKLKGKLSESQAEIERLKAELAAKNTVKVDIKRPKPEDFDTDEQYEKAFDDYENAKVNALLNATRKEEQVGKTQEQLINRITKAVDDHIERANTFVTKNSIKPEVYEKATDNVRNAIEELVPGKRAFDQFLDIVGEGSEMTMFAVGLNKTYLSTFKEKLREDPLGMKAAFYLGSLTGTLNAKQNKTSRAPKPTPGLKGDGGSVATSKLKSSYDKEKDPQKRFSLRRQAKKSGIDTTKW